MKRLTVHVKGAKATMENRKNKKGDFVKVPVIKNTQAHEFSNDAEITHILEAIKEDGLTITKHYTSNIK